MRLVTISEQGEVSLTPEIEYHLPQYAILSHTWLSNPDAEVHYEDIAEGSYAIKEGYEKLKFCRNQADMDKLQYFWIDTCCIQKSSESELSRAIRSMFRWYRGAAKCYVFLSDVRVPGNASSRNWESDFVNSRWFKRGWTLQELLAPVTVEFFSKEGTKLGDKRSLESLIHKATQIPIAAIRGATPTAFRIEDRLSWIQGRETKRDEDMVYSLLGLFDVHIPILYGEGRDNALKRMLREVQDGMPSNLLNAQYTAPFASQYYHVSRSDALGLPQTLRSAVELKQSLQHKSDVMFSDRRNQLHRTWLGEVCTEIQTERYNHLRERLSDAAKFGDWESLWEIIMVGRREFDESWVNAVRIKPRDDVGDMSFWTLLHQAVYMEAPVDTVQRLLDMGASRTLRTRQTEFAEHDLTPLELAHILQREYLYHLLAPTMLSPVPLATLSKLEAQFHALISADLGQKVDRDKMYLPMLHVIVELRMEFIWFPIQIGPFKAGYRFQLQDRELLVVFMNIPSPVTQRTYRITACGTKKIEEYFRHDEA